MMLITASLGASMFMLLTGNTVADNITKEVSDKAEPFANNIVSEENNSLPAKAVLLDPPLGPYSKENILEAGVPKGPITLKEAVIEPKEIDSKANSVVFEMDAPKYKAENVQKPAAPVLTHNPPQRVENNIAIPLVLNETIKQPIMNSKAVPAWLKQGYVASQNYNLVSNGMSLSGTQNHRAMPYMRQNKPVQQYIYIPVPILIPTVMPQIPSPPSFNYGVPRFFNKNINQKNNKQVAPEYKEKAK